MPKSYDFEVTLRGARPRVWRRFLLSTSATFFDLHVALQRACGWQDSHLFDFHSEKPARRIAGVPDDWEADGPEVPDARDVRLSGWFGKGRKSVVYEYDFGDCWVHDVELRGVVDHDEKHKRKLLGGARAFPPEDCGGMSGYERLVELVKTGEDPWGDIDGDEIGEWVGDWDPERFDVEAVRKRFDSRTAKKQALVVSTQAPAARAPRPASERNAWCSLLDIDVPDVAAVALRKPTYGPLRLADLVVTALLETGAAMTDDEVLARLREAGVDDSNGDLQRKLKRSLASTQAPLLRDHAQRLTVDLKSVSLSVMLSSLGLRAPRSVQPPVPPPVVVDGPLTRDEVDAAYDGRISTTETKARFVAAVLDAERGPLTLEQIAERFAAYGGDRRRFTSADAKVFARREDLIVDGEFVRLADDADLRGLRDAIRARAQRTFDARQRTAAMEESRKNYDERERARRAAAVHLRRAVFTTTPTAEAPTSITAFDFARDTQVSFSGATLDAFAAWIATFDVVVGVRPHLTLGALGVDFHRFAKVVDLMPSKKTQTIDGRQVPIVWREVVAATLGGVDDPSGLAALVALYRYALMHRTLWMPAPGGSEQVELVVDAGVDGDGMAWHALDAARATGDIVALWVGTPPELASSSTKRRGGLVRGRVVEVRRDHVVIVNDAGRREAVALADVTCVDVTGADDFAWRLPVLSRA